MGEPSLVGLTSSHPQTATVIGGFLSGAETLVVLWQQHRSSVSKRGSTFRWDQVWKRSLITTVTCLLVSHTHSLWTAEDNSGAAWRQSRVHDKEKEPENHFLISSSKCNTRSYITSKVGSFVSLLWKERGANNRSVVWGSDRFWSLIANDYVPQQMQSL